MRFVLISLGFLGWAFYELSGGAEFDPSDIRAARLAAEADKQAERQQAQAAAARKAVEPVVVAEAPRVRVSTNAATSAADAENGVTRVSLNLTTLENAQDTAAPLATPRATVVPENVTSSADTPAIIPSLIAPNDSGTIQTATGLADDGVVRTVAGNRVNVRGGPGTDFGVVGRLVRGDEIRILEDNGAGWVRFEAVDGSTDGWMAEFLLADS